MHILKLGLEVHAQLLAARKLFSRARPSVRQAPNSGVAYFDAALPGTQPRLSLSCLERALRASLALQANIAKKFSFDRKHYFYPDQPSGYQITQRYEPIAKNGVLKLLPRDFEGNPHLQRPAQPLAVLIEQIQMEQDTGKTTYVDDTSLVDLNRANTPLIEVITAPTFTHAEQAVVFVRKLQTLLRHIGVCSGEMESGAMRVDVNVSVQDDEGKDLTERCEIKNLFSTSAIRHAVNYEFARQCEVLKNNGSVSQETRGWDGRRTWRIRSKETALDYRYMPDPDLPRFVLPDGAVESVRAALPELPDTVISQLLGEPYSLRTADAFTIMDTPGAPEFVIAATNEFIKRGGKNPHLVGTYFVHRWLGIPGSHPAVPSDMLQFVDVLLRVDSGMVSTTTGRLLLTYIAQGYTGSVDSIIKEFQLECTKAPAGELEQQCAQVIAAHSDVVAKIKAGKKSSIGFLLGQVMRETQGTQNPKEIRQELIRQIESA